jgi:hypothetical protein
VAVQKTRYHHEAHEAREERKTFLQDLMPSPLSDLRVLRDLRGDEINATVPYSPKGSLKSHFLRK